MTTWLDAIPNPLESDLISKRRVGFYPTMSPRLPQTVGWNPTLKGRSSVPVVTRIGQIRRVRDQAMLHRVDPASVGWVLPHPTHTRIHANGGVKPHPTPYSCTYRSRLDHGSPYRPNPASTSIR